LVQSCGAFKAAVKLVKAAQLGRRCGEIFVSLPQVRANRSNRCKAVSIVIYTLTLTERSNDTSKERSSDDVYLYQMERFSRHADISLRDPRCRDRRGMRCGTRVTRSRDELRKLQYRIPENGSPGALRGRKARNADNDVIRELSPYEMRQLSSVTQPR
jgi:hypothetical protein